MKPIPITFEELQALINWHIDMCFQTRDHDCFAESKYHESRAESLDQMYVEMQREKLRVQIKNLATGNLEKPLWGVASRSDILYRVLEVQDEVRLGGGVKNGNDKA